MSMDLIVVTLVHNVSMQQIPSDHIIATISLDTNVSFKTLSHLLFPWLPADITAYDLV
jgi:hypothetical protein